MGSSLTPGSTPARGPSLGRSLVAACLLTAAGASMDTCVYLDHGHVLAAAQTGNIVLFAIHVAAGEFGQATRHVPSFLAFCAGVVISRIAAQALRRRGLPSRPVRLAAESVALLVLALISHRMTDDAVVASIGFLAGYHISSYSHLENWSFNTGMTTGNLWNALRALTAAVTGDGDRGPALRKAAVFACLVGSFLAGAIFGADAVLHVHDRSLLITAGLVAGAAASLWPSRAVNQES